MDEPVARLQRALADHPRATYVRVEVIDLRAALATTLTPALDDADLDSILLALGHFPTWFDETAEKVQAMRDSLAEKS